MQKLQVALHEFDVEGVATNIPFLRRLIAHPAYIEGEFTTAFVPQFLEEEQNAPVTA